MVQHPLLRCRLAPLFIPHRRGGMIRSAQPRDYSVDWRGWQGTERGDLNREASPLPHPCSRSNPLSFLLGRLLDDFMPHKNDIKFVKTARCNDRTAWPYGVGTKGVSRGRKENARASGEQKERTAGTSSKRNRNREQPWGILFLTAIDMIPSYENKLRTVRRMRQYARKKVHSFFIHLVKM